MFLFFIFLFCPPGVFPLKPEQADLHEVIPARLREECAPFVRDKRRALTKPKKKWKKKKKKKTVDGTAGPLQTEKGADIAKKPVESLMTDQQATSTNTELEVNNEVVLNSDGTCLSESQTKKVSSLSKVRQHGNDGGAVSTIKPVNIDGALVNVNGELRMMSSIADAESKHVSVSLKPTSIAVPIPTSATLTTATPGATATKIYTPTTSGVSPTTAPSDAISVPSSAPHASDSLLSSESPSTTSERTVLANSALSTTSSSAPSSLTQPTPCLSAPTSSIGMSVTASSTSTNTTPTIQTSSAPVVSTSSVPTGTPTSSAPATASVTSAPDAPTRSAPGTDQTSDPADPSDTANSTAASLPMESDMDSDVDNGLDSDLDSDLDVSESNPSLSEMPPFPVSLSSAKPPIPTDTTAGHPSTTLADRIQSVISQNAFILSSISGALPKPARSAVLSTSSQSTTPAIQQPCPDIQPTTSVQNATQRVARLKHTEPVSLLAEAPVSVIAARRETSPPNVQATQTDPLTLLKFSKDVAVTKVPGAIEVTKQVPGKVASKSKQSTPKVQHQKAASSQMSLSKGWIATGITDNTKDLEIYAVKPTEKGGTFCKMKLIPTGNVDATSGSKNTTPLSIVTSVPGTRNATSQIAAPSTSGSATPAISAKEQQSKSIVVPQSKLSEVEASNLSRLAKAFNTDVANIVLAVKKERQTSKGKIISETPLQSQALSAVSEVLNNAVIPSSILPGLSLTQTFQTPTGSMRLQLCQPATPSTVAPSVSTIPSSSSPNTSVTSAVTTTVDTPSEVPATSSTLAPSAIASPSSGSPSTSAASAVVTTVGAPSGTPLSAASSTDTPSVVASPSSGSTSTASSTVVTPSGATSISTQRPPRKQALVVRKELAETISDLRDQIKSNQTRRRRSPQKHAGIANYKDEPRLDSSETSTRTSPRRTSGTRAGKSLSPDASETATKASQNPESVVGARKSPRKQVASTKESQTSESPGVDTRSIISGSRKRKSSFILSSSRVRRVILTEEPGTSKSSDAEGTISGSKKRKSSSSPSPSGRGYQANDDSEKAKKVAAHVPTLMEGRKTRAQSREDALPSRRTRSQKR